MHSSWKLRINLMNRNFQNLLSAVMCRKLFVKYKELLKSEWNYSSMPILTWVIKINYIKVYICSYHLVKLWSQNEFFTVHICSNLKNSQYIEFQHTNGVRKNGILVRICTDRNDDESARRLFGTCTKDNCYLLRNCIHSCYVQM